MPKEWKKPKPTEGSTCRLPPTRKEDDCRNK